MIDTNKGFEELLTDYFQAVCAYHGPMDWPVEEMTERALKMDAARSALTEYHLRAISSKQQGEK